MTSFIKATLTAMVLGMHVWIKAVPREEANQTIICISMVKKIFSNKRHLRQQKTKEKKDSDLTHLINHHFRLRMLTFKLRRVKYKKL